MTDLRHHAPRRYFVDASGQRVLIGLTAEETVEFERLDSQPVVGRADGLLMQDVRERCVHTAELRWRQLYAQHENAWKAWMVQNRAAGSKGFSLC
ncbi:hypothetical protein [Bradyrhizobium liaoningense]|uniref:hypothetical protein n=1 Tax=Bradyrhizobium liaoningense TaxID=43992 RepID=UPI001BA78828|nr:hypothetical protein [Bradyrhizobium liaoningense]MBR1171022.1 hypothetical protein [Bradyrhizobium liaoningense]